MAFGRVLLALYQAHQHDDDDGILELGTAGRTYLRGVTNGKGYVLSETDQPEFYDFELSRPMMAEYLRDRMRRQLAFLATTEGDDIKHLGKACGHMLIATIWSARSELDAELEAAGVLAFLLDSNLFPPSKQVAPRVGLVLGNTPRAEWGSKETAATVIVQGLLALGVSETTARGLFRFDEQRQKRRGKRPPEGPPDGA